MKKLIIFFLFISSFCHAQKLIPDDKAAHILAGALISQTTYIYTYKFTQDKNKALICSIVTPILVGTIKELYDSRKGGSGFDVKDLGCTVIGATIVIPLNLFVYKNKK